MIKINISTYAGRFAENKDVARTLRVEQIIPALKNGDDIILDFEKVDAATQSFIHALISDVLRQLGSQTLEHISFKSCNENIKKIIEIVIDYMQEGMDDNDL